MMSLLTALNTYLSKSPLSEAKDIVVAYSGGVDSHVLLHALYKLKQSQAYDFSLHAIHIHHGLSQNADFWQQHCQQVCVALGVAFQTANVAVKAQARQSLEAQARDARYQKLMELAPAASHIVLAQHQDDQLETFLLQLKRGAGPKGLSAMNQKWSVNCLPQSAKQLHFERPLLAVSQRDILDYAQQHQLKWCEDESNQDTQFERNFLRKEVLPLLLDRWPELASSVSRSAKLCAQQQNMLDEICAEKLKSAQSAKSGLLLSQLHELNTQWLHQVVRYWLSNLGIPTPSLAVLNQLKPDVIDATDDANPILQWQGWQFRRFNQQLFVIPVPDVLPDFVHVWQGETTLTLPANIGKLNFTKDNNTGSNTSALYINELANLTIRLGKFSTKFKPKGSPMSKPLKQWFKQWSIAPWDRAQTLLFIQDEVLIAILLEGKWHLSEGYHAPTENMVKVEYQAKKLR